MFTEWYYNKSGDLTKILESFIESNKSKEVLSGFVPNPVAGFLFSDITCVGPETETPLLYDRFQHELNYENELAYTTQPYPIMCGEYDVNRIYGLHYMNEIHIFGEKNQSEVLLPEMKGTVLRRILKYQCLENTLFNITYKIDADVLFISSYIPDNVEGIIFALDLSPEESNVITKDILEKTENVVRMMEIGY